MITHQTAWSWLEECRAGLDSVYANLVDRRAIQNVASSRTPDQNPAELLGNNRPVSHPFPIADEETDSLLPRSTSSSEPASPSGATPSSRKVPRPTLASTDTQDLTSAYTRSLVAAPSTGQDVDAPGRRHAGNTPIYETQDITDPSITLSRSDPQKTSAASGQTLTASSAASHDRQSQLQQGQDSKLKSAARGNKVKFDLPRTSGADLANMSAITDITTPGNTAGRSSALEKVSSSHTGVLKNLRDLVRQHDATRFPPRLALDPKGKGRALDEPEPRSYQMLSHPVMHSTPSMPPRPPQSRMKHPDTTRSTSSDLSAPPKRDRSSTSPDGAGPFTPTKRPRPDRSTSASDVAAALRRSRLLGSDGELAQWDVSSQDDTAAEESQAPAPLRSAPAAAAPLTKTKNAARKSPQQPVRQTKSTTARKPSAAAQATTNSKKALEFSTQKPAIETSPARSVRSVAGARPRIHPPHPQQQQQSNIDADASSETGHIGEGGAVATGGKGTKRKLAMTTAASMSDLERIPSASSKGPAAGRSRVHGRGRGQGTAATGRGRGGGRGSAVLTGTRTVSAPVSVGGAGILTGDPHREGGAQQRSGQIAAREEGKAHRKLQLDTSMSRS
ncbi:hypothetical protein OC846_004891 [Tilletia horrida]|uniref:Uncharacterized protein n=1 Tax=Tilletia horrida TaxID=155126 RepID=A0AAN6GPD8_9BASI|nr:hypothetical protein OC845_005037 [Tilletia horrida]KAK0547350.1 hypothetical protein OC846_004891 [Tilletia horrida]KAK0562779.1 hypothetical protein OC861_005136 [Tilletia horrida]